MLKNTSRGKMVQNETRNTKRRGWPRQLTECLKGFVCI